MQRKTFIAIIEGLDAQYKRDIAVAEVLSSVFTNTHASNFMPNNKFWKDSLFLTLAMLMDDHEDWIKYYCYSLDFGRKKRIIKDDIILSNAGELYDFLMKL